MTSTGASSRELVVFSLTEAPPAGAAAFNATPQLNTPDMFGSGEQASSEIAPPPASRAIDAVRDTPFNDAVTTALSLPAIAPAVATNAAEVEPAGTTTDV